jgi:acetyltransferase-like isoleucine patch superfamily enzyme
MGLGLRIILHNYCRLWRSYFASRYLVASIGKNCDLRPGCAIEGGKPAPGQDYKGIRLGDGVVLYPGVVLTSDFHKPESGIEIGNNTWINRNTLIQGSGGVAIGSDVLFGPAVIVWSSGHEFDKPNVPVILQGLTYAPVTIGNGSWIGAGAIILPGVTIGEGAVIGAGSVVTNDIAPGMLAFGNPARKIRLRGGK